MPWADPLQLEVATSIEYDTYGRVTAMRYDPEDADYPTKYEDRCAITFDYDDDARTIEVSLAYDIKQDDGSLEKVRRTGMVRYACQGDPSLPDWPIPDDPYEYWGVESRLELE